MKKIILFFAILSLVSCTDYGHKTSIMEPLTDDQLAANMEKDPEFEEMYQGIALIREFLKLDQTSVVKYREITYGDVIKFKSIELDKKEVDKMHLQEYPTRKSLRHQADSLLNVYHGLQTDSLVRIEFIGKSIAKRYGSDIHRLSFKVTPLKGSLDELTFSYLIAPKSKGYTKYDDKSYNDMSGYIFDIKNLHGEKSVYDEHYHMKDEHLKTLKGEYDTFFEIGKLTYKGMSLKNADWVIQETVENWEECQKTWKEDETEHIKVLDKIASRVIDKSYISLESYYNLKVEEKQKEEFPLLYDLLDI